MRNRRPSNAILEGLIFLFTMMSSLKHTQIEIILRHCNNLAILQKSVYCIFFFFMAKLLPWLKVNKALIDYPYIQHIQ